MKKMSLYSQETQHQVDRQGERARLHRPLGRAQLAIHMDAPHPGLPGALDLLAAQVLRCHD